MFDQAVALLRRELSGRRAGALVIGIAALGFAAGQVVETELAPLVLCAAILGGLAFGYAK